MNQPSPSIGIRAGDLKPAVTGLGKLLTRRTRRPVLRCVKVETPRRDTLRLTATDGALFLTVDAPARPARKVDPFLLPVERLRDLVRETRAGDELALAPGPGAPPVAEFPGPPRLRAAPAELPDATVTGLLRAFACASGEERRYVLQGAFLEPGKRTARLVGTDGRHLFCRRSVSLPGVKSPVILPDHPLWRWKPLAESRPWTLRLGGPTKGNAALRPFRIEGPTWSVAGRTIDGRYPAYRQAIPRAAEFRSRAVLSDAALDTVARLLPRLPGRKTANRPVGLHLEKGRLGLLAREDTGEPWELHPVEGVEAQGPDRTVFLDRGYLRRAVDFGLGEIALADPARAVRFTGGHDLLIVMPVRAADPDRIRRPRRGPVAGREAA